MMGDTANDKEYRQVLRAITRGADDQVIAEMLNSYPILQARFRRLSHASRPPPTGPPPRAVKPAVRSEEAMPPAISANKKLPQTISVKKKLPPAISVKSEVLAPLRAYSDDVPTQLVKLVLMGSGILATQRLRMLKYVRSQARKKGTYRELTILRGLPGIGKSNWAMNQLLDEVQVAESQEAAVRYTHICAPNDFFARHHAGASDFEPVLQCDPEHLDMYHAKNIGRVQLAMEVGINPLYVDSAHVQLWEMAPYVRLAQQHGYEYIITTPQEISTEFDNVELLASVNSAIPRELLEKMAEAFEELPTTDQLQAILSAERTPRAGAPLPSAA